MNKYLEKVVLPFFKQYVDANFSIGLFDLNGVLLECSKFAAISFNIKYEEALGLSYKKATPKFIQKVCTTSNEQHIMQIVKLFELVGKIQEIVIKEKIPVNYIDFTPYKKYFKTDLVCHTPIFNEKGEIIGTQALSSEYHLFGITDYLDTLSNNSTLSTIKNTSIELGISKREHEVIFLMLCGMTQIDIAMFLNVSRGTVSKAIERLCSKFAIQGISTVKLLEHARKIKLHEYIPVSFNQPRIVILDPGIQAKYKELLSK